MKKIIALFALLAVSMSAFSSFLPEVGNGTEPNQWTKNVEGVLSAAKTTGYPIFVLIINDSNDGVGCDHCKTFINQTINTTAFNALKGSNKFYMVLLNYWSGANGYYSNISPYHNRWRTKSTSAIYANADVLPDIAVVDPYTGEKAAGWGVPWGDSGNRTSKIKEVLDQYVKHTSKFSIESSASTTVVQGKSWNGQVVRSGGSKLTGTASLTLSGKNSGYYTVNPSSLSWGTGDGSQAFTVSGPSKKVDPVLMDTITVTVAGVTDGADVVYGNKSKTLTFKDARIKKTLTEFAQSNSGLEGLSASNAVWFVSTNAAPLALETVFNNESRLTLTATKPGILSVALSPASLKTATNQATWIPKSGTAVVANLTENTLKFGVSVGDKVEFKFTTSVAEAAVGFSTLAFQPLALTLDKPANGASFGWPNVCADATLVDFAWHSNAGDPDYSLYATTSGIGSVFSGTKVSMGANTSTNGVAAGLVVTNTVMGNCYWGVKLSDTSADVGVACTTASATFAITAKPEYDNPSVFVSGYLKCGTDYDFSATSPAGTGPVTYTVKGLPAGLSLDAATGKVSGTPKKAGTYNITVTAANSYGSVTKSVALTVAKFPNAIKGNYNGVFFAGKTMPYSITWKIATSGKWTGKLALDTGKTKSLKGQVIFDENGLVKLPSTDLTITQIAGTALWTGTWGGATMYGKVTAKLDSSMVGTWPAAAWPSEDLSFGAYVVSKSASSGKVSFSGKVNAKQKISAKGQALLLTGAEIAKYVADWANGGKAGVFVQGCKKTSGKVFCGGMVFWSDKFCDGRFTIDGLDFNNVHGSIWSKSQSLASLNGAEFAAIGDFSIVNFGVVATDKKLSAGENAYSAKISAKVAKGIVSGSFKQNGVTFKYEGALYLDESGAVRFFGGVIGGSQIGFFTSGL